MNFKRIISIVLVCLLAATSMTAKGRKNKAPVRVTCIGASITEGATTDDPANDSYPAQLGRMLGNRYVVSNFGVSGTTMLRKGDSPYWETEAYKQALASEPQIVFIDLGGNDSKAVNRKHMDEFVKDACEMIASFQNLPTKPRVIVLTPIVSFVEDKNGIYEDVICRYVVSKTIEAADRMRVEVLDMHMVLNRHPELMPDRIHPNKQGSQMMAKKMYEYLKAYPEKPSAGITIDGMANNPFVTHIFTADPSAHVWDDGRLYVYASHDIFPPRGCDYMDGYHVFSTDDMVNWVDHGEILHSSQVPWGRKDGGFMWAPDCAYNPEDGLYYFYFPHPENTENWNSTWRIGVAVSRYPDKEFHVAGYVKGMASAIDPCIFIDDDGQPYLYNGGGGKCYVAKLRRDDWTKLESAPVQMQGLHDFHEAAWVHKYGGKYYLSHSDNHSPSKGGNNMRYAVSDNPAGPWEDMGVYMYPQGVETNHGSIVRFKGQWYAFYHTSNYSGHGTLRSVCVDPVNINPDGSIETVRNWGVAKGGKSPVLSSAGLTFKGSDFNDGGYHYAWFTRDRQAPSIMNGSVKGLEAGEWLRWSFKAETAGTGTAECVLSSSDGARVIVSVNGEYPETSGHQVPSSGKLKIEGLKVPMGECYLELRVLAGSVDVSSVDVVLE